MSDLLEQAAVPPANSTQPQGIPLGFCWCGCGQKTNIARETYKRDGIKKGQPFHYLAYHHHRHKSLKAISSMPLRNQNSDIPYGFCACGCGRRTPIAKRTIVATGMRRGEPCRYVRHHSGKTRPYFIVQDCGYKTPCWIWQRAKNRLGYAIQHEEFGTTLVHKAAYIRKYGPVPSGLKLDHLCKMAPCINPDHVEPVTQRVNVRRGRATKLTEDTVREIRRLREEQHMTHAAIAARFGIKPNYSINVCSRRIWADVK
jgi:hypothetical protein